MLILLNLLKIQRSKFNEFLNNSIEEIKKIQIKELEKDYSINYKEITNIQENLIADPRVSNSYFIIRNWYRSY